MISQSAAAAVKFHNARDIALLQPILAKRNTPGSSP